jgi:hypothetical protein
MSASDSPCVDLVHLGITTTREYLPEVGTNRTLVYHHINSVLFEPIIAIIQEFQSSTSESIHREYEKPSFMCLFDTLSVQRKPEDEYPITHQLSISDGEYSQNSGLVQRSIGVLVDIKRLWSQSVTDLTGMEIGEGFDFLQNIGGFALKLKHALVLKVVWD